LEGRRKEQEEEEEEEEENWIFFGRGAGVGFFALDFWLGSFAFSRAF
jgi:hypothetical protein